MDFRKATYRDQDAAFLRLVPSVSMHSLEPGGFPTGLFRFVLGVSCCSGQRQHVEPMLPAIVVRKRAQLVSAPATPRAGLASCQGDRS